MSFFQQLNELPICIKKLIFIDYMIFYDEENQDVDKNKNENIRLITSNDFLNNKIHLYPKDQECPDWITDQDQESQLDYFDTNYDQSLQNDNYIMDEMYQQMQQDINQEMQDNLYNDIDNQFKFEPINQNFDDWETDPEDEDDEDEDKEEQYLESEIKYVQESQL